MSALDRPTRPGDMIAAEDATALGALRRAIADGTKTRSFRDFVRQAGIPNERAHNVARRLMRRHVVKDRLPGTPPSIRMRLAGTALATPWAPVPHAGGVKHVPKAPKAGARRCASSSPLVGKGAHLHPTQQAKRDESRRIHNHQRRMASAGRQSEDDLSRLVEEHIRTRGVTFIQPEHVAGPAPAPVGTRGGMLSLSDGASMARKR